MSMRRMSCRALVILPTLLLLIGPAHAQTDLRVSQPAHYSIQESTTGTFQKKIFYIGHYGEAFSYLDGWKIHPAMLKDGIEIVRFHDEEPGAPRVVPESSFDKLENYSGLGLVQLLVIPKNRGGFQDFSALRAAKTRELTAQGATYEIAGAPSPEDYWPKNTFQVVVTAPYLLHQVYVESEGKIFILTGGRDVQGSGHYRFGVTFDDEFVASLGDYFERLHRVPYVAPPERYDFSFSSSKWVCLPLLGMGLLLLGMPWAKKYTGPLAAAALTAAIASVVLRTLSFFVARWLSSIGAGFLVSPGVIGWAAIPMLLAILFYGSRELDRPHKWIVRVLSLLSAVLLAISARETHLEIVGGEFRIAESFSAHMFVVGLFYGACFGLSRNSARESKKSTVLVLALLVLVKMPSLARAQNGVNPESIEGKAVVLDADVIEAAQRIDARSRNGELYRQRATIKLQKDHLLYDHQRVEITGILSTDDTAAFAKGMFDLSLKPSHNNEPPDIKEAAESKGFLGNFVYTLKHGKENAQKDVNDLFDDKTGKLTPRAREILAPLMDKNVHVNEVVAHSWGAIMLNNAIREGLINPPSRIVVVGVPDSDFLKWRQLGKYTGTEVVIYDNSWDMAQAVAHAHDFIENLDIAGKQTTYNEGAIAHSWEQWSKNPNNRPVRAVDPGMMLYHGEMLPGRENSFGHGRQQYYHALMARGILKETVEELKSDQSGLVVALAQELREEDIKNEVAAIREMGAARPARNSTQSQAPQSSTQSSGSSSCFIAGSAGMIVCPYQSLPAALAYVPPAVVAAASRINWIEDMRALAVSACDGGPSLSDAGLLAVEWYNLYGFQNCNDNAVKRSAAMSARLAGCEKMVFDRTVDMLQSRSPAFQNTQELVGLVNGFRGEQSASSYQGGSYSSGNNRTDARADTRTYASDNQAYNDDWNRRMKEIDVRTKESLDRIYKQSQDDFERKKQEQADAGRGTPFFGKGK